MSPQNQFHFKLYIVRNMLNLNIIIPRKDINTLLDIDLNGNYIFTTERIINVTLIM